MKRLTALILPLLLIPSVGCHRQTNSSSAHNDSSDEQQNTEQILAKQRQTLMAENEVTAAVKADTGRWVQHELGWWYRYTHKAEEHINYMHTPLPQDTCMLIHERVCTLDGQLLLDAIRTYDRCSEGSDTPEKEEPFAYQIMLSEMVPQDTVLILTAWYAAYGKEGRGVIPPLANLRVLLTMHTTPLEDVRLTSDSTDNKVILVPIGQNEYETFNPDYPLSANDADRSNSLRQE